MQTLQRAHRQRCLDRDRWDKQRLGRCALVVAEWRIQRENAIEDRPLLLLVFGSKGQHLTEVWPVAALRL